MYCTISVSLIELEESIDQLLLQDVVMILMWKICRASLQEVLPTLFCTPPVPQEWEFSIMENSDNILQPLDTWWDSATKKSQDPQQSDYFQSLTGRTSCQCQVYPTPLWLNCVAVLAPDNRCLLCSPWFIISLAWTQWHIQCLRQHS